MQNIATLLLILAPMAFAFALPVSTSYAKKAETALNYLVLVILVVIGIELGLVQDIKQQAGAILLYLLTLMSLTIGSGLMALILFDKCMPTARLNATQSASQNNVSLRGSLLQLGCLALGFVLATCLPNALLPPDKSIAVLLMLLLFLVGICLKGARIGLKHALFNKRGLQLSIIFTISTLCGGVLFALLFADVSISQGLALASGFGWYSLSGTIMTEAYGAVWGTVALFNDLGREMLALLFIPWVMRLSPSAAIGLGGVTSLDFTLPTLTQAGGTELIPLIISFGLISNVISPVLMVFFASLT